VTRLIGGPFSPAQVQERLGREIAMQREHGVQYWPIFRLDSQVHVGCCGLRPYDLERRVYELGFHVRRAHWGQGYGLEAARAVLPYAFGAAGAAALFAGHHPRNEVSRRVLERLGFRRTGDVFYAPTGLQHPSYWLAAPRA
jgi:RimJ/RimL family protein N-acetyltransferase